MKKTTSRLLLLLTALGLLAPLSLQAQTGITGKLATTGFGFDMTRSVTDTLNLRAGYNRLGVITGYDFDDNLRLDLQLESIPLLLDWHLLDSSFRITGGVYYNRNRATISARANDVVEVDDNRFRVDSYSIKVDFDDFAPYIGFGWGRANDPAYRFAFAFDFGLLFQGSPDVTGRAIASSPDQQARLDSAFDAELASRSSDADTFKIYPVVSLGLSFRF